MSQLCVDKSPTSTGDTSDGPPVPTETCPAGQVWSQYAGACVLGGDVPVVGKSGSSGCGAGPGPGASWLFAGLALLALAWRRRRA